MSVPTFDEWFLEKYRTTFEDMYQQHGMDISRAFKALSFHMREYISEIART